MTMMNTTTPTPPPPDLGKPSQSARIVVLTVGIAFLALLIWALVAPLNRGIIAPGRVDVDSRRSTVKHKDGGMIAKINVREGDRVRTGDVLAIMDGREAQVQLDIMTSRRMQALIETATRTAEANNASNVTWPSEVLQAISDPSTSAAQWAAIQQQAFLARRRALDSQVSILREQRMRMGARIDGLDATDSALRRQSALLNEEAAGLRQLQRQGFAPKNRVLATERGGAEIQGRIGDNQSQIAQSRIAMGESEMQIVQTQAQSVEAAARRLSELNAEISELDNRILGQKLLLERTTIRAPVDGIILARVAGAPGQVIQPSEPLFELVPSDKLVIRAEVRPTDVERINVGMEAGIRFSGLNSQTTPRLSGRVSFVGADAQVDQKQGTGFYEMRVDVSIDELKKLGNQSIRSGMPVEVFADGGARTAWAYLMEPIVRTYERAFKE
jgi:HlyD family type I secretion membrane fusion protein